MLFILEFLPSWVFLALIGLGALGYLATYLIKFVPVPMVYVYKNPIQIASIVLMIFATFMYGGAYNNDAWMAKVKEMEDKVAVAEEQAKKENVRIEEKIVETTKEIKVKGDTIVKEIQVPGPERIKGSFSSGTTGFPMHCCAQASGINVFSSSLGGSPTKRILKTFDSSPYFVFIYST